MVQLATTRTSVDAVALEARADALASRSVKADAKERMLHLLVACCDLTTLEGTDTAGRVRSLCAKAVRPGGIRVPAPSVAAVCVYPSLVPTAVEALAGTDVAVASVAGAFPSGLAPLELRLAEIRWAVAAGADEIDIVLNRSALLEGRYGVVVEEVAAAKDACGAAHLKVILETGELGSYDRVRQATELAIAGGADFVKTSTGKIAVGATLPAALCMAEAVRDHRDRTGAAVGIKISGGVRTAKSAWQYLVVIQETLGADWLGPELFRVGASTLLTDLTMQLSYLASGRYDRPEHHPAD